MEKGINNHLIHPKCTAGAQLRPVNYIFAEMQEVKKFYPMIYSFKFLYAFKY
jgi:hypothetical protein